MSEINPEAVEVAAQAIYKVTPYPLKACEALARIALAAAAPLIVEDRALRAGRRIEDQAAYIDRLTAERDAARAQINAADQETVKGIEAVGFTPPRYYLERIRAALAGDSREVGRCTCGPDLTGEAPDERGDCPIHGRPFEGPYTDEPPF